MQDLVYILAALNTFYRSAHWRSKGAFFYQDHLLFARLYENLDDEIDDLVELLIGFTGDDSFVSPQLFNEKTRKFIPIGRSNARANLENAGLIEAELLERIAKIKESEASVGVYNQLATIADNHTRNLYLIRQTIKTDA